MLKHFSEPAELETITRSVSAIFLMLFTKWTKIDCDFRKLEISQSSAATNSPFFSAEVVEVMQEFIEVCLLAERRLLNVD